MINRYKYDEEFEQLTESLIYLNEDEGEPGFFASIWGKVSGYFSSLWNKTSTEAEGAKVSGSDEGIIAKFLNKFKNIILDDENEIFTDRYYFVAKKSSIIN